MDCNVMIFTETSLNNGVTDDAIKLAGHHTLRQAAHPEAAFILAGDFNHSNLKTMLPKFHQHFFCNARRNKPLDHVYMNIAGAYTTTHLPYLGKSDQLSLFLIPKYSPLFQHVKPSVTTIKVWPAGTDSVLQNKFHHTDWVCLLLRLSVALTQILTPTVFLCWTISTPPSTVLQHGNRSPGFPNQKPSMNKEVQLLLMAHNTAFRSGDAQAYSTYKANLRRGIINAEHCYKLKVGGHFSTSDPCGRASRPLQNQRLHLDNHRCFLPESSLW